MMLTTMISALADDARLRGEPLPVVWMPALALADLAAVIAWELGSQGLYPLPQYGFKYDGVTFLPNHIWD
jgi:hypothetical protein